MPGDFKLTVFRINRTGGYKLAFDEQFANFIFYLSFKTICSLCIMRIRITAKNEGNLSKSQLIIVQHEKIVDPFFIQWMSWI
jgi:hypothetical protein